MIKIFLRTTYFLVLKHLLRLCKGCSFERGSELSLHTRFEGKNALKKNSELRDSYIGYASYCAEGAWLKNCKIGRYTSIGPFVYTVVGRHPTHFVSTHPAFYSLQKQAGFCFVSNQKFAEFVPPQENGYATTIGNDVWIGAKALIMEGVTIHDGAIIGAGAVVTNDIPPYAIAVGVPAKVIRYRFSKEDISFLLELKWWDQDYRWISRYADHFDNINDLKAILTTESDKGDCHL